MTDMTAEELVDALVSAEVDAAVCSCDDPNCTIDHAGHVNRLRAALLAHIDGVRARALEEAAREVDAIEAGSDPTLEVLLEAAERIRSLSRPSPASPPVVTPPDANPRCPNCGSISDPRPNGYATCRMPTCSKTFRSATTSTTPAQENDDPRCPKCAGATEFVTLHRDGSGRRFFACQDGSCGGGVWLTASSPSREEIVEALRDVTSLLGAYAGHVGDGIADTALAIARSILARHCEGGEKEGR
jgi:hypothetical protein